MDANGDELLDYATIQILPSENRYEAYTCHDNKVENVGVGVLEKLLPHLPGLHNLYTQGSNADYKLQPPNNLNSAHCFTKSTFTRFLHLVSSTELVATAKGIEGEISLLEEARKFHLSLYAQGHEDHTQSSEKDISNSEDGLLASKFEVHSSLLDSSKNELLRAMDSRLTALRSELVAAFNQVVGETCSYKEITHLVKFSEMFGANDVKNLMCKFLELSQKSQVANLSDDEKSLSTFASVNDRINKTDGNNQISKPLNSGTPVKYGVSPAKAAQVERQSSTESEEFSDSSDEIQTSAERSRALIRSASPRRSASPMRRVQIGRGGSRRAPALTIKSLIPAREKMLSQTEVASEDSGEEGSAQAKKPENNVLRMSVQDAINLFERKQRDQIPDVPKRNSLTNISLGANKAVLRRWSSGMGESSSQCQSQNSYEDPVPEPPDNAVDNDIMGSSAEVNLEPDTRTEAQNIDETVDVTVDRLEESSSSPIDVHVVTDIIQEEEANGRSKSSAEWSKKKEEELNQMFKRMMENQPVSRSKPQTKVRQNLASEQRGGFYDHYKEKRDKKLRGENDGKRAEKEEKFRAMQKILDERKAEMASKKVNNLRKKDPPTKNLNSAKNTQKLQKNPSRPATAKETEKETSKLSSVKKISSRTSPLPTRKSWPSTPSPRTRGPSPAKTSGGISSAGTMPTSRKPQSAQSVHRVSPKVESSQPQRRNVNAAQANKRGSMSLNEKQSQKLTTSNKTTKTKVAAARGGDSSIVVPAKPSLYNKVTKKSTVVPLESKPFLRKGSGLTSTAGVVNKIKNPSKLDPLKNNENSIDAQESDILVNASVSVNEYQDHSFSSLDHHDDANQPERKANGHQKCDVIESADELAPDFEEDLKNIGGSSQGVEESIISPTAWVEIEEHQNLPDQCDDQPGEMASSACIAPIESASPRVRHSLSQMLQEESSEADAIEWGNAENPPAMVYQKDAPKGLKRLLKFARKSKGDANITGWSSPSVFSEGEDDTEDSKVYNKKNADNLLRKAALHARNYEHNLDAHELPSAQSGISSFDPQKVQKGSVSAAASTTKGTRSFFSLSAFRGSKPSDMKLRQS